MSAPPGVQGILRYTSPCIAPEPVRVPFLVCLLRHEIEVLKHQAPPKKRGFQCFQLEESKMVPPAARVLAYLIARHHAGLNLKTE